MTGRCCRGEKFFPLRTDGKTDKMNSINGENKIPNGWVETTIGDVFDFQYGKSLPQKKRNPEGNYPVYGSNGRVGSHDQYFVHGPVIIIGRKGGVGEVSICKENCWPIDTTYYVIPPNGVDINFAYFLLKYADLRKLDTSTAIPGLNRNEAYKIKIPLPPLPEQRRIVAKIERLFSKFDKGVAQLKKAKQKLELYRQSLLKAAFEGRLTEKWRKEHADELESAEELLARIKAEREKRFQQQLEEWKQAVKEWEAQGKPGKKPKKPRKQKELPPLTQEELAELPELPEGWVFAKFGNVYDIVDGDRGKNYPKKQDFSTHGYCLFLNTKNVRPDGFNFSATQFISKEKHESLRKGCLKRGDVIFTSRGTIGHVAYYSDDIPFEVVRINSGMFILRGASNMVEPEYLLYCLQSQIIQNQITRFRSGTAQPQLPIREFQEFGLPIPSIEEQREIIKIVKLQLSVKKKLTRTIDSALARAELLRQSILKKAFSGKLVPQDPNDEPASEFLKRIKAEREKAKTEGRKVKRTRRRRK